MGQMPVLETNGRTIHQSISISRFLGKKFGLAGSNDLENAEIDSVVDSVNDFRQSEILMGGIVKFSKYIYFIIVEIAIAHYEEDTSAHKNKRKILNDEQIPFYLKKFDEIAKLNNGHLALKRMTWADFYFTGVKDYMSHMAQMDLTANHSNLKQVIDKVMAIESIKQWAAARPPSAY